MAYSKGALSRESTWRGLNKPLGSPNPLSASAHSGASRSGITSRGLSTHEQKRKLPPHEQKKKTHGLRLNRNFPQLSFNKD